MPELTITNKSNRKSIRLLNYDYSSEGWYFVTICVHDNKNLFGNIINNTVELNPLGIIAKQQWLSIPNHFNNVKLDEFIVMPNHLHGIIDIGCDGSDTTMGKMVAFFKYQSTKQFNNFQNNARIQKFWQRNYYERIIRDEYELYFAREYIKNNPCDDNGCDDRAKS